MADEPSVTRWSFQDFKMYYDTKFGRKMEIEPHNDDEIGTDHQGFRKAVSSNGHSVSCNGTSNGNGTATPVKKNTSDLAIYEQYHRQEGRGAPSHTNGVVSNGLNEPPKKSLLPPFESAEMRTLAESLSR